MELDELKAAWSRLDQRVDHLLALALDARKQSVFDKTRSALRRTKGLAVFELISCAVWLPFLSLFLFDHRLEVKFAVSALLLYAFLLPSMAAGIRQLVMIGRIDYSEPVIAIQRRLGQLRALRIRTFQWQFSLGLLLWPVFFVVLLKGVFGFDILRGAGVGIVAINIGAGALAIPVLIWAARSLPERLRRWGLWKRLVDDIAGRSLAIATGFLDEIARFEQE